MKELGIINPDSRHTVEPPEAVNIFLPPLSVF